MKLQPKSNSSSLDPEDMERQQYPPVLMVDDEPFNTEALSLMLKEKGYSSDVAVSGKQALELINARIS